MDLQGARVLLTGATGGLGRAIAEAVAARGGTLILSGRTLADLEALADELPGDHEAQEADLAEPGAAAELCGRAGIVDVLVANAGLPGSGLIADFSAEQIERALRVNLEAPVQMTRELLPPMQERASGHLVYVASLSGKIATARTSLYNATKFGLRGFALGTREDLRGSGVGASIVSPGFIRDAGMFADGGGQVPGYVGTSSPEEVGAGVVEAVTDNVGEIVVAPRQLRVAAQLGLVAPEPIGKVAAKLGAADMGDEMSSAQQDKR
ncbi:MAG: SDR family NAD(P)-dependent oxidoreductase [Solirubrobacterales bacterium]